MYLFTRRDSNSGERIVRNSTLVRWFMDRRFQRVKDNSFKFDFNNFIEYPREFAERHKLDNRSFVINISKDQFIDLQIVHPRLVDDQEIDHSFGFTIDLPFNTDDTAGRRELALFKSSECLNRFEHYRSKDRMDHYKCDCATDLNLLQSLCRSILIDIKGYGLEDKLLIDHFFLDHP